LFNCKKKQEPKLGGAAENRQLGLKSKQLEKERKRIPRNKFLSFPIIELDT
jgi:hypothetical protein